MRFHVINLPHTQTTKEFLPCAYTQKVVNFCRMMKSLGHIVYLYGSEQNEAPCDEFITCITKDEQKSNNWKKEFFAIEWNPNVSYWKIMNDNTIIEIGRRIERTDFICIIGGNCQKPISDAFPNHSSVEYGIGYEGVYSKYRVFESYAWMHYVYGLTKQMNGNYYDTVIPNYFDPADFPLGDKKQDYFLFIGRMISRKGAHIAAQVCKELGVKLILAGQGVREQKDGKIVADDMIIEGDVEHVGVVGVKERGELMSKARAVFVPTQYIGPFEGVHAEAMMCGTPVITTDWGVFSETVYDGLNGFRTRTMGEMIEAAKLCDKLNYKEIRDYAIGRFSLNVVRHQYDTYFQRLLQLWGDGWYSKDSLNMEQRCLRS